MFDTMTVTKAAAGLFGTFLVLLLAKWGADVLYSSDSHLAEAAYIIETESSGESADGEEVVVGDYVKGKLDGASGEVNQGLLACHDFFF